MDTTYERLTKPIVSGACGKCRGWYTKLDDALVPDEVFGEGTACSCEGGPTEAPRRVTQPVSMSIVKE